MTIDVMGASWDIVKRSYKDDPIFINCDGYCDPTIKTIVIEVESSGSFADMAAYLRKVTRHEIVHAFLFECGLYESSAKAKHWARNEEMVDWIARIGPRIYKAWLDANAIDPEKEKE